MNTEKNAHFFNRFLSLFTVLLFLLLPVTGERDCDTSSNKQTESQSLLLKYKFGAIAAILAAGGVGVSIPLIGKKIKVLRPENNVFFLIKAFAAGVILATGFVHILPDAFRVFDSPCLDHHPWTEFPFAGMVAMAAAIVTLMIDTWATSFLNKKHSTSLKPTQVENADDESIQVAIVENDHESSTNARSSAETATVSDLLRRRIISQVLELGIVVHSLVIGVTMGTSESVSTIKPLLIALSFHQFFEGMGLGGCISQAQFKSASTTAMAIFFSLTAPVGIGIGIVISSSYTQGRSTTGGGGMIVEGILESASAGILIYTALVDLLAADFMDPRMQSNPRLLLGAQLSLLLGAGCMSLLARWA